MNKRSALLGSFVVSLLLTGCPLTDHYQLMSEMAGAPSAGSDDGGSTNQAGAPASGGGGRAPTAGQPDPGTAGEAGESMVSGGSGGLLEMSGGGNGGTAGGSGSGGDAGASELGGMGGSSGAPTCNQLCPAQEICCTTACANLATSAANCGACDAACNSPRQCAGSVCKNGWIAMSTPPMGFGARSRAAVVAMGKSVFYWGGQDGNGNALNNGAIYRPVTNDWKFLPVDPGAPSARIMASAVWTGSVVIVFGGTDASGQNIYRDGAIYDTGSNSWSALPASTTISKRSAPLGYWDGTRAFFWSGLGASGAGISNVDRFDLTSWSVSGNPGDPGAVLYPAFGFDGSVMYALGGQIGNNRSDKGYTYSASTDMWTPLPKAGFNLTPRSSAFGAWDGTHFVVWGGRDDNGLRTDGQYFSAGKWTTMSTGPGSGAPTARMIGFRRSGWAFQASAGVVAVIGGQTSINQGTLTTTGASYNVAQGQWTTIPSWPSGEPHEYGMGVWTGEEFVLWGGRDTNTVSSTGERWAP